MASDPADALAARARPLFVLNGVGFLGWQSADGALFADLAPASAAGPLFILAGVGFSVWLVTLILIFGVSWHARKAGVFDRLSDEWALRARKKAAETAFWITLVACALFMTASNFGVDGGFLLKTLLGLSVASMLIAYARYEGAGGAEPEDA